MSALRDFARILGGALDGALASLHPSEAVDRAHALNEFEAEHDGLEPAECGICRSERAQHPSLISIACGTPGCPNFSEQSAPGLTGLVERTGPEAAPPVASGPSKPTTGGGTASVGDQPLPGAVATPGAGQPLSLILLSAAGFASAGGAPVWICSAVMDLADQFRADELDAINN